ncbi:hypothetical protein QJS10_CPA10g01975 [Acorus calamus]|uniref:Exocyst subunit Exo70 family protein n=1 Tax=Acorus calamus TaxID=4465 RepID=A0AAV9E2B4_ACOCL|nr:hypothetical protein QJS10_CPA10g01975 [Acorus calamus]
MADTAVIPHERNRQAIPSVRQNLSVGMFKVVSDIDEGLSTMTITDLNSGAADIEERLKCLEEKILRWESESSMIWESGPSEASDYMQYVDEVRRLIEILESSPSFQDSDGIKLLDRAHGLIQMALSRLEEEFGFILVQNKQPLEPERMSFRSNDEEVVDEFSCSSFEEDISEVSGVRFSRDYPSKGPDEYIINLIDPVLIPDLKRIADLMFLSNYDKECSMAYINIRKDAIEECLSVLEVEKLSIEEVTRMDWASLDSKIRRWIRVMKVFVRVYLSSEKYLSDQIFGGFPGSFSQSCFIETTKGAMLQLLNFGQAISIGPQSTERLPRMIHLFEVLADLLPIIESLFPDEETGSSVRTECHEVLRQLGACVRGTFQEFKIRIKMNESTTAITTGRNHPLTRYVMNYITLLADSSEILDSLLVNGDERDRLLVMPKAFPTITEEDEEGDSSCKAPLVAHHLREVTSILEANLEDKALLYSDTSLQHFFMMNNIYYMVQKVKDSVLQPLFGDDWIRAHQRTFRQHAMDYERASWPLILSYLKDEGVCNPGTNSPSKTILKERFRCFNLAFEEIYRVQTAWLIPDPQLREDLRISISLRLLQAYRTFTGRYSSHLNSTRHREKYIRFCGEDLEKYLLDLFEGVPKSLHYPRRR